MTEERAIGCMVGVLLGDVLGAAVEGERPDKIASDYPDGVRDFLSASHMGIYHLPPRFGMYTDDTQSTLALAASLIEKGKLDPQDCAVKHAQFWERGCTKRWDPKLKDFKILPEDQVQYPLRGYPDSMKSLMTKVLQGTSVQKTGRMNFPDGSYGNGGAMRIAPVAVAFRNASLEEVKAAVIGATLFSHVHPEAVDGTYIHAIAIQYCFKHTVEDFNVKDFLAFLNSHTSAEKMKKKLQQLHDSWDNQDTDFVQLALGMCDNGFQIFCPDAVVCALLAFVRYYQQPEEALVKCIAIGGDTDTTASMCGALVGALHGVDWWPARWWDNVENGDYGRDYLVSSAKKLFALDLVEAVAR